METRIIIKTHTECLRPALYSILILRCTSPTQSAYPRKVEADLSHILSQQGISGQGEERKAAAKFAVYIAHRHLKLLGAKMAWDWRGQALAAILEKTGKTRDTDPQKLNELRPEEQFIFLKYFLEADGAVICGLSAVLAQCGRVTNQMMYDRIEEIFSRIYDAYLSLASDFRERMQVKAQLREIEKQIKGESRKRSTLPHKVLPHMQALVDLGVLHEAIDRRTYEPVQYAGHSSVAPLGELFDHLDEFEKVFSEGNPYRLIAATYGLSTRDASIEADWDVLTSTISKGYALLEDPTTATAHMSALADWTCVSLLAEHRLLISPRGVNEALKELARREPSSVRFHVDYSGEPAYVILARGD
jgi:hypothetical protein